MLLEGAHATLLDLDHGTYPYVTSSHCTVAGLLQGSGVGPRRLTRAIGVYKAYCSRVGEGPFPTELFDATGERIREIGHEYGTTTGRPRRCGWFDAVAGRHSSRVNAFDGIALTRLDMLTGFAELRVCVGVRGRRAARSTTSRARSKRWSGAARSTRRFLAGTSR